jgi:hypothetical protein
MTATTPGVRYSGTKTLIAWPMTRGQYNAYRTWTPPEGKDQTTAGYLVEYADGGPANDSRHAGYISWSPADVFERTYKPEANSFIQPKIAGYRQLGKVEADLMNQAKALGAAFEGLIAELRRYHAKQKDDVQPDAEGNAAERSRLRDAEPERWLAMGRTDIQTGVMKIVRSIAQPAS